MNQKSSGKNSDLAYQAMIQTIKAGGKPALESLEENQYPNDFVTFMDQMIHGKKIKRKDIIARSGLAEDYAYKLLNGGKKTRERDYIIAICIGAGLNVPQTQHALICSGMLPLSESDIRSKVIIMGIQRGLSVYHINGHLEEQNLPLIRTASDMPSVRISDTFHWDPVTNSISIVSTSDQTKNSEKEEQHNYTMAEISVSHDEMLPEDIFANVYNATTVVMDEQGNHYYLEYQVGIEEAGTNLYVRTEEQYLRYYQNSKEESNNTQSEKTGSDYLEYFESLLDATKSPFFACFISMDRKIDKQIEQQIADADDTKNYGMRMEVYPKDFNINNPAVFIEFYNSANPELKEYFQLIRYADGKLIYTGSHESRFQRMRMGDSYKSIYKKEDSEQSFFMQAEADSVHDLEPRYRYYFLLLRYYLNQYIQEKYRGLGIKKDILIREILDFLKEQAKICYYEDKYDEAWQSYREAERLIEQLDSLKERLIRSSQNTINLLIVSTHLGETDETVKFEKKLYEIKQEALKQEKTLTPDEQKEIFTPICFMLYNKFLDADNSETGKEKEADLLLQELIDMIENHYALSDKDDGFKKCTSS